ncbi:HtaA domain-containing protein [Streptomyces sp. MP131-18]|uniref:HtaA domain-containing protein n=1 Tax=Streptomyces sp. MP131-18 TaxID=1857892 RepID=UPI0009C53498|nr:HtaA domain-containing protein [Streptomyces sp. MP131-18]ONK14830.1 Htaa [Streptomyces sp. MP131-18]
MLPSTPRRHVRALRALFALLSLALPLVLLPGHTAQAAERTVAGGRLDWGIKTSFQTYVTGPIANGAYELTGGAATVGENQFRFHSASGGYDPDTGAFEAGYGGGVHFTGHRKDDGSHELDLTISNPTVRIAGDSGTLHADMRSKERGTGVVTETAQVPLADLDLTGVDLRGGTSIAVTGIPATLTAEGAAAFAGYYRAGDALDPVTLTADTEAPAEPEPEPEPSDDGDGDGEADAADGAIAAGAVDWGVRRTFREYVTGPIAEGSWQVADGAQDGGALFRFPAASGTADPERGTVEAEFTGAVRFTGSGLDLTLGGFTVTVADGEGTLAADVTTDGGEPAADRPLITFEAAGPAPRDGLILLNEAPAELTEEGAAAFGGLYPPGTAMDPVTLAFALDGDAELPPLPDLGSEPAAAESPRAADPGTDPGEAPAAAEPADDGGTPTTLIATGTGVSLALAAAAYVLLRRTRRARHNGIPKETDPS